MGHCLRCGVFHRAGGILALLLRVRQWSACGFPITVVRSRRGFLPTHHRFRPIRILPYCARCRLIGESVLMRRRLLVIVALSESRLVIRWDCLAVDLVLLFDFLVCSSARDLRVCASRIPDSRVFPYPHARQERPRIGLSR